MLPVAISCAAVAQGIVGGGSCTGLEEEHWLLQRDLKEMGSTEWVLSADEQLAAAQNETIAGKRACDSSDTAITQIMLHQA